MTNSFSYISCLGKHCLCLLLSMIFLFSFHTFLSICVCILPLPHLLEFFKATKVRGALSGDLEGKGCFPPSPSPILFII